MIRFDHVVYAVPSLVEASKVFREEWGLHVVEGGAHPNWGTHNSLCHFGLAYLEFIAVQDPGRARESDFGRAVLRRAEPGGGLVTAAFATDDLDGAVAWARRHGVNVDGPFEGRRRRPDGSLLQWRMAWPERFGDMEMPFLIQWQQSDAEREADLRQRGLIVNRQPALGPMVYTVADLAEAGEAFYRWYGQAPGEAFVDEHLGRRCARIDALSITLCESDAGLPAGPAAICLTVNGGTSRWLVD